FLKVEYGRGSGVSAPAMWLTVGKSSDGAGSIGSVLIPRSQLGTTAGAATFDAAPRDGYASTGDGSMVALVLGVGAAATALPAFVVDRSRDSAGVPTSDGVSAAFPSTASTTILSSNVNSGAPRLLRAANYATGGDTLSSIPVTLPGIINGV